MLQYDVSLDPSQPATAFKQAIYERTGVPIDRQKVMVKGGMLKVGRPVVQWLDMGADCQPLCMQDEMDLTKIGARSVSAKNQRE